MAVTATLIHDALASVGALGGQITSLEALAAGATGALVAAPSGLTVEGAAALLATCAEESAWYRTTTEYGRNLSYDPYRGRTFIQVTWSSNYLGFGQWCQALGLVSNSRFFVDNPAALSDLRWAWLGPVWYFASRDLWKYANRGQFLEVSQGVNGGMGRVGTSFIPNGWPERQRAYAVFHAAGAALLPGPGAAGDGGRLRRQQDLLI